MSRRWSYLVACLLAGAVLGACQGTDTLRLANLPASDPVTLAPVVNEKLPLPLKTFVPRIVQLARGSLTSVEPSTR